jgi:hypothetical protein
MVLGVVETGEGAGINLELRAGVAFRF